MKRFRMRISCGCCVCSTFTGHDLESHRFSTSESQQPCRKHRSAEPRSSSAEGKSSVLGSSRLTRQLRGSNAAELLGPTNWRRRISQKIKKDSSGRRCLPRFRDAQRIRLSKTTAVKKILPYVKP